VIFDKAGESDRYQLFRNWTGHSLGGEFLG